MSVSVPENRRLLTSASHVHVEKHEYAVERSANLLYACLEAVRIL